jgi:phosphatidylglycerophosphate synthase
VADKQVSMWTGMLSVPNFITLARLCVLPVFLYLLFAKDQRAGAAG